MTSSLLARPWHGRPRLAAGLHCGEQQRATRRRRGSRAAVSLAARLFAVALLRTAQRARPHALRRPDFARRMQTRALPGLLFAAAALLSRRTHACQSSLSTAALHVRPCVYISTGRRLHSGAQPHRGGLGPSSMPTGARRAPHSLGLFFADKTLQARTHACLLACPPSILVGALLGAGPLFASRSASSLSAVRRCRTGIYMPPSAV